MRFRIVIAILLLMAGEGFALTQDNVISEQRRQALQTMVSQADESQQHGDYNQAVMLYNQAAKGYLMYGMTKPAMDLLEKALKYSRVLGNTNGILILENQLGMLAYEQGNLSSACSYFNEGIDFARKNGRKADLATMLVSLSNALFEQGKYSDVQQNIGEAIPLATQLNSLPLLQSCYSIASRVSEKLGDRKKTTEYFDLYTTVTKKIQQQEMVAKEAEANIKVEQAHQRVQEVQAAKQLTEKELAENQKSLEKAEQLSREMQLQIELLNKDRMLKEAIIARQELMRWIYIAIIAVSLMFAALIYYGYHSKKRANQLLQQRNEEIIRQNQEIQTQAEELRLINDQKNKLFSIIAHDLRSPLSSLVTLLNVANSGYISDEDFKVAIHELSENVSHTASLLENLLNWARCQMQRVTVSRVPVNLQALVEDKINLLKEHFRSKGVVVKNSVAANCNVLADYDMVALVFRNLLSNAIKFCIAGDSIYVSATIAANEVVVEVKDTGVGMSPDSVSRLFGSQIFTTPGTANEAGTGLGLILCKEFVELNGGKIWAKSVLHEGTSFFFTLEALPPTQSAIRDLPLQTTEPQLN